MRGRNSTIALNDTIHRAIGLERDQFNNLLTFATGAEVFILPAMLSAGMSPLIGYTNALDSDSVLVEYKLAFEADPVFLRMAVNQHAT